MNNIGFGGALRWQVNTALRWQVNIYFSLRDRSWYIFFFKKKKLVFSCACCSLHLHLQSKMKICCPKFQSCSCWELCFMVELSFLNHLYFLILLFYFHVVKYGSWNFKLPRKQSMNLPWPHLNSEVVREEDGMEEWLVWLASCCFVSSK